MDKFYYRYVMKTKTNQHQENNHPTNVYFDSFAFSTYSFTLPVLECVSVLVPGREVHGEKFLLYSLHWPKRWRLGGKKVLIPLRTTKLTVSPRSGTDKARRHDNINSSPEVESET